MLIKKAYFCSSLMKRLITAAVLALTCLTSLYAGDFQWIGARWWGISVSYSQKWYSYSAGGSRHWTNYWAEGGHMQGLRFGVPVQPLIYRDWGVSTGPYCEIYSCRNKAFTARIEDVALYFPFHAMWRHNFTPKFALQVETGPGLTVGMVQRVIDPTNSDNHQYYLPYNDGTPQRVNCYWEAGVAATVNIFRFSIDYGVGLTPAKRFFSTAGLMTNFYSVNPTRLTVSAALVF